MLLWGVKRALLALAAGAFGVLALPPFNVFAALFVSFTLLVWLIDGATGNPAGGIFSRLRSAFWTGWLFGFGYFVAGLWWLGHALMIDAEEFAWALPLAVFGLPAFLALYYGLAAVIARILWSDGMGRIAALALGFGLAEWLRSFLATGFPWNAVGYGIMPVPLMMQSVHVVGLFGVSTLAVFIFAAPALFGTRRGLVPGIGLAALLFLAHLGYGAYVLNQPEPQSPEPAVTVRLVQPMIDQAKKIDDSERNSIFEEHLALSVSPLKEGEKRPDIIIWPETSVPFILTENEDALTRIADTLEEGQVLIAGAVRAEDMGPGLEPRYYNSVYAIDDKGQIVSASDKVHLVPFGEYLPFEDLWRSLGVDKAIADMPGGFSAAARRTLLTLPGGSSFYPLICYEAIFPEEITPDIGRADAILNVTNDAWFGDTPGPYQHFQQARIRAVEEGVPLIRSANSGISAVIDARGQVVAGLDFNQKATIEATMGGKVASSFDAGSRKNNFWLIIFGATLIAAISRQGFIKGGELTKNP